jgi:hypothetical protein
MATHAPITLNIACAGIFSISMEVWVCTVIETMINDGMGV